MEQLNIKAVITATSKKQNDKFGEKESPRKSIYFDVAPEDKPKAVEFGLQPYTSQEDGKEFFIVQATEVIDLYNQNNEVYATVDGGVEGDNFNTGNEDDGYKEVTLAILKGQSRGNDFYRLKGIKGEIEYVEKRNLFAD